MLTGRGWAIIGAGVLMWLASRLLGSADLHMVAVGILSLIPLAALLVRFSRPDIVAVRRLSTRRAFPGTRVRVDLEIHNVGKRRTSVLIVEDQIPRTLGPAAKSVAGEIRGGAREHVGYWIVPRTRGRYSIGPLTVWSTDPFDLIRRRIDVDVRHDLIVYPEVEQIGPAPVAAPVGGAGDSSTRQLFRSGEDFYTMRQYEEGDDLRRIHWPSVAKTGELMIRQDETARRAAAAIFIDTRASAFPRPAFERAVSAAASIGALYLRAGFRLRLATPDVAPIAIDLDTFLETLAIIRQGRVQQLTPALQRLARPVAGGGALVVVTHVPAAAEIAALSHLAPAAGSRLAVLVKEEEDAPRLGWAREAHDVEAARGSLGRSGWDVLVLPHDARLSELWPRRRGIRRAIAASS
ncbi:MAG: DUF58 domain-containing protein [Actinomycetota bacterium]